MCINDSNRKREKERKNHRVVDFICWGASFHQSIDCGAQCQFNFHYEPMINMCLHETRRHSNKTLSCKSPHTHNQRILLWLFFSFTLSCCYCYCFWLMRLKGTEIRFDLYTWMQKIEKEKNPQQTLIMCAVDRRRMHFMRLQLLELFLN